MRAERSGVDPPTQRGALGAWDLGANDHTKQAPPQNPKQPLSNAHNSCKRLKTAVFIKDIVFLEKLFEKTTAMPHPPHQPKKIAPNASKLAFEAIFICVSIESAKVLKRFRRSVCR